MHCTSKVLPRVYSAAGKDNYAPCFAESMQDCSGRFNWKAHFEPLRRELVILHVDASVGSLQVLFPLWR